MADIEKVVTKLMGKEGFRDIEINKYLKTEDMGRLFSHKMIPNEILNKVDYIPRMLTWCVPEFASNRSEFSWDETLRLYDETIKINPTLVYENMYAAMLRTLDEYCPAGAKQRIKSLEQIAKEENNETKQKKEEKTRELNRQISEAKKNKKNNLSDIISSIDYLNLQSSLSMEVLGQEDAIRQIVKSLIDVKHKGWPKKGVNSIYMSGPSGVGKTSSIEHLAKDILETPFLYIQGSDYKERHEASRLKGPPPGYIGYNNKGGIIPRFIKENSEGIILFDEIDKVHPDIYEYLISFLGDGFVTTPEGERHDFKGFIYFTSNDGNKEIDSAIGRTVGFNAIDYSNQEMEREKVLKILRNKGISEAFLGRINNFVAFKHLSQDILYDILNKEIEELNFGELKTYTINLSESAKEEILRQGSPEKWGARNLKNMLDRYSISEFNYTIEMERIKIPENTVVAVDFEDDDFVYRMDDNEILRKNKESFIF